MPARSRGTSSVTFDVPVRIVWRDEPSRRFVAPALGLAKPDPLDKIVSMYARGMTVREIRAHLEELYCIDVSPDLISTVTDAMLEAVAECQGWPLDTCIWIEQISSARTMIRGIIVSKERRQVLAARHERAQASRHRRYPDRGRRGLKGFPEAINAVFPQTIVQTASCI